MILGVKPVPCHAVLALTSASKLRLEYCILVPDGSDDGRKLKKEINGLDC